MLDSFPVLREMVCLIGQKNAFQKKALKVFLESCSCDFLAGSEQYLSNYVSFLQSKDIDLEYIAESYSMVVKDMLVEQTIFLRTGKYRYDCLKDVYEKVYSNKEYMFRYMIGIALSQFLWRNHRDMFLFFKKNIKDKSGDSYLEIGPGHGIFFVEAVSMSVFENYHAIDISDTSLEITKDFISHSVDIDNVNVSFHLGDIAKHAIEGTYDFITMGEVLEHVEEPRRLLKSIHYLLTDEGHAYISTCANAPVIDHIYLYNSIDEIREDITKSQLEIVDEIIICNDGIKKEDWVSKKANLGYACIAKKSD